MSSIEDKGRSTLSGDECLGYGYCLPESSVDVDDLTGNIVWTIRRNIFSPCNSFTYSYTGTKEGGGTISFTDIDPQMAITLGNINSYTSLYIELSCNSDDCLCSQTFSVTEGERPEDEPIVTPNNCGREYYSHSFELINGEVHIICDDPDYDEYDPLKDPFRMVIDSWHIKTYHPGDEMDDTPFPRSSARNVPMGTVSLPSLDFNTYATVYFYSSECTKPEQHHYYMEYSWMNDVSNMNLYVHPVNNHIIE